MERALTYSVWLALCVGAPGAAASDLSQLQSQLNQTYVGQTLVLRGFYSGGKLEYDANGELVRGGQPGPWTVDGKLLVGRLVLRHNRLQIDGNRVWEEYDDHARSFSGIRSDALRIRVAFDPAHADSATLQNLLSRVFLARGESFVDQVPSYWGAYLEGRVKAAHQPLLGPPRDATAPVPLSDPNPPYSEEARRAKYSGSVSLLLRVDADGTVQSVQIAKPAGLGLDEQAVKAVLSWKFKPATRDGKPVGVEVSTTTTFKLF